MRDRSPEAPESAIVGAIPPRSWSEGIAPHAIMLFLLVLYFDRLPAVTLARGGLIAALLGILAAGMLAFLLYFWLPALAGYRSRCDLVDLIEAGLGSVVTRFLVSPLMALAQVAWFAVVIAYASEVSLKALGLTGVVEPLALGIGADGHLDPRGRIYLGTTLLWGISAAVLGPPLGRIIVAVMYGYAAVPAIALGVLMLTQLDGVSYLAGPTWLLGPGPGGAAVGGSAGLTWASFWSSLTFVSAYATSAGVAAAAWGRGSRRASDITRGGVVGLGLAPAILAAVTLVTVAGAWGYEHQARQATGSPIPGQGAQAPPSPPPFPDSLSYVDLVLSRRVGGLLGCTIVMGLTLLVLVPASQTVIAAREWLGRLSPAVPGPWRTVIVSAIAWPLMISGRAVDLPRAFGLIGGAVAPLLAVAAVVAMQTGLGTRRPPPTLPRRTITLLGWAAGTLVGVVPIVGPSLGLPSAATVQPAALLAFGVTALVTIAAGWLGGGRAADVAMEGPSPEV